MLHDRDTGRSRALTENFDRSCGAPRWSADSRRLYFDADDKAHGRLFSVSIKGNDVTPLTSGHTDHIGSLNRDGGLLAFSRSSFGGNRCHPICQGCSSPATATRRGPTRASGPAGPGPPA